MRGETQQLAIDAALQTKHTIHTIHTIHPIHYITGNTTAAVGKGFAIGSAALVSLALYGAFVVRIKVASLDAVAFSNVMILQPMTFAFLLIGSMIPYWFSAMTMKSVGKAAMEMVAEVGGTL